MMTIRLQIIVVVLMILSFVFIINLVRKKQIELKYALMWLIVGGIVLVMDCVPKLMDVLAVQLGIASPVNMLFFLGFCFSLVIIFILTIVVSRLSVRIKNLAQEIALYEKDE